MLDTVARVAVRFSVNPSARNACALSPLKLAKGRIAIAGFSGRGTASDAATLAVLGASQTRHHMIPPATSATARPVMVSHRNGRDRRPAAVEASPTDS